MQKNEVVFTDTLYSEHLETISGVSFTPREIDVIACLLNVRGTSKIASLLSIALRTVITHIHNIMLKLECNSREGIIDFIERSHKISFLREYYASLITEVAFEKSLKEVSKLIHEKSPKCLVIYWENQNLKDAFFQYLSIHLQHAGIKAEVRDYKSHQKIEVVENLNHCLIFLLSKEVEDQIPQELAIFRSIDLSEHNNYYLAFFEIFKSFTPNASSIDTIFLNFHNYFNGLQYAFKNEKDKAQETEVNKNYRNFFNIILFLKKKWYAIFCLSVLGIASMGVLIYKISNELNKTSSQTYSENQETSPKASIRADLIIPTESSFLSRSELIDQIDNKFKSQKGIQTIALIGPGGAGKTTLARQYAHEQKASVIWEVNAETQETLRLSFENLAQALAKTEETKDLLREIQDVKDTEVKERKIIQFVKEQLLIDPNWFLIFDNIEKFSDIQKHFPQDVGTWGEGKIILTTRNNNIGNNSHIDNVVQVGELSSDKKAKLFIKILSQGNEASFALPQTEELKAFLEHIPPFPLDVSVAAYYLKAAQIPYTTYLKDLAKHDEDFENMQKNLLKEAGDYTKTRYGIISLSLQHMINLDEDFRDLLLFISLLDSQNITRDLLEKYKNQEIVDNFLYNLRKHSFITNEVLLSSSIEPTFSIHRSTQEISLAYFTKELNLQRTINNQRVQSISRVFSDYVADVGDKEDLPKMKILVSHGKKFLNYTKLLNASTRNSISCALGYIYYYLGDYAKAKEILLSNLISLRAQPNRNYVELARALTHLGQIYAITGDYEKAKKVLGQSILVCKQNLSENCIELAKALESLGLVYRFLGAYEKAKNSLEKALLIREKTSSKNDAGIGSVLGNLGSVYMSLGNFEKAESLFKQSLAAYGSQSKNHIGVGWAQAHLGNVYRFLGDYKKAEDFLEQSLKMYKEQLNPNHVGIARDLYYLGRVYVDLKDYKKAKSLFEQSLIIFKKNFSEDHLDVARVLINLGEIQSLENNIESAEKLIKGALNIFLQKKHPESYIPLEIFAEVYLRKSLNAMNNGDKKHSQDSKNRAISYLKQALSVVKIHFPKDSPHIARIQSKLQSTSE